jgi:hypothetical protein
MVLQLNKIKTALICTLVFIGLSVFSQKETDEANYTDYKDPKQFEKFNRRRKTIGAWQINELKKGALVVRLKTNKLLIDNLIKQGNSDLARQKELEIYAINKNTVFAYLDNFNFCKVYFMFSNSSDSLLAGQRSGIFLDTALNVNPTIVMNESFYILAERDFAYNSSIGFVKEDSAKLVVEKGNPVKEMSVILKNKYGHQLKAPFPYYVKEKNFMDAGFDFPIRISPTANGGQQISFYINRTYLQDLKTNSVPNNARSTKGSSTGHTTVKVKKQFTYEKLSLYVEELNQNLKEYYQANPSPDPTRISPALKVFLY